MGNTEKQWKALAARYKQGRCTPEELSLIEDWYDKLGKQGHLVPDERVMNHAASRATDKALERISFMARQARVKKLLPWLSAAAALFVLLTTAGLLLFRHNPKEPGVTWRSASAAAGTRKMLTLPDGSVIWLNSASTIRYPLPFAARNREIELTGEAFFSVAPDHERPFTVHTQQLDVRVLGTSYNISAYPDEHEIKVAVATGKVAVSLKGDAKGTAHILTAGHALQYDRRTAGITPATPDPSTIGAWQKNELIFNFERLEDIARKLERHYGVSIAIRNKALQNRRFELRVRNQPLSTVMKLLSISGGNFSYKIERKQVTIG